jgi:hypothetical protein
MKCSLEESVYGCLAVGFLFLVNRDKLIIQAIGPSIFKTITFKARRNSCCVCFKDYFLGFHRA